MIFHYQNIHRSNFFYNRTLILGQGTYENKHLLFLSLGCLLQIIVHVQHFSFSIVSVHLEHPDRECNELFMNPSNETQRAAGDQVKNPLAENIFENSFLHNFSFRNQLKSSIFLWFLTRVAKFTLILCYGCSKKLKSSQSDLDN